MFKQGLLYAFNLCLALLDTNLCCFVSVLSVVLCLPGALLCSVFIFSGLLSVFGGCALLVFPPLCCKDGHASLFAVCGGT